MEPWVGAEVGTVVGTGVGSAGCAGVTSVEGSDVGATGVGTAGFTVVGLPDFVGVVAVGSAAGGATVCAGVGATLGVGEGKTEVFSPRLSLNSSISSARIQSSFSDIIQYATHSSS